MPISLTKNLAARKAKKVVKKVFHRIKKGKTTPLGSPGIADPSQAFCHQADVPSGMTSAVASVLDNPQERGPKVKDVPSNDPDNVVYRDTPANLDTITAGTQSATTTATATTTHLSLLSSAITRSQTDLSLAAACEEKDKSLEAENALLHARIQELENEKLISEEEHKKLERKAAASKALVLQILKRERELQRKCDQLRGVMMAAKEIQEWYQTELEKTRKELEQPVKLVDFLKQHGDLPMYQVTQLVNKELESERRRRSRDQFFAAMRSKHSSSSGSSSGSF